jgi:hypothetical protein
MMFPKCPPQKEAVNSANLTTLRRKFLINAIGARVVASLPTTMWVAVTELPSKSYNPWVSLYWLVTGKTVGGVALINYCGWLKHICNRKIETSSQRV